MRLRIVIVGVLALVLAFAGAMLGMQFLWPSASDSGRKPALAELAPLPPASGTSVIVAPTVVTHAALRDALEAQVPREVAGKRDYPASKNFTNAEVSWAVARGALAVHGKPELLAVVTALNGKVRATGQLQSKAADRVGNAITGLLGREAARTVEKLAARPLDQSADIRGASVTVIVRPAITPAWRIDPKISTQVVLPDMTLNIAGARLNVGNEVKPLLERQVNEQIARLEEALRNDPILEQTARQQWARLCRSFPLGAVRAGLPELWLEFRPTRAIAAQPRIDAEASAFVIGVEAQTRVIPNETKPECPFPATLDIVPPTEPGRVRIALPIDVPFPEVNRLISAQLAGKTLPEDGSGALAVTVRSASVAPSGDRLLISLQVKATERQSWFGLGTEATIHIWGKPQLDTKTQVLRLSEVALAVESEGVLGAAVRAAAPILERAVAERAVIDLKPFAANARKSIDAAFAELSNGNDGVRIDAAVTDVVMAAIAFDATTLRIVAEAEGAAKVQVTKLPAR